MKYYVFLMLPVCFLLFKSNTYAQLFYKSGHIVTNSGDTVHGLIRESGAISKSKKCKFIQPDKDQAIIYTPSDIKSYYINDGQYYRSVNVSVKNKKEPRFVDVLIEGNYSLYYYRKNKEQLYYLNTPQNRLIGLSNEKINVAEISDGFNYRSIYEHSKYYIDSLYEEFKEWVPAGHKLPLVEYNHKDLMEITKAYLNAICDKGDCITFERNLKLKKANAGVYFGTYLTQVHVVYYNATSQTVPSYTAGIFYSAPLSLISSNIDFQLELLWRNLKGNLNIDDIPQHFVDADIKSNTIGLPLILKYNLHGKRNSLAFGAGYEYGLVLESEVNYKGQVLQPDGRFLFGDIEKITHKFQRGAWLADISYTYKLNDKVNLCMGIRLQLLENLILEEEYDNRLTFNTAMRKTDALKYKSKIFGLRIGVMF